MCFNIFLSSDSLLFLGYTGNYLEKNLDLIFKGDMSSRNSVRVTYFERNVSWHHPREMNIHPTLAPQNVGRYLAPEEITHEMNTWGLTH